eukprot:scaffold19313_cov75-Skeletonema_dohrnii-CCMP3373.AAC.6
MKNRGGGEEELLRTAVTSTVDEEREGGLLVDWDQSKKKKSTNNRSLNDDDDDDDSSSNDGESKEGGVKGKGDDTLDAVACPRGDSSENVEAANNNANNTSEFRPAQIKKLVPANLGNRLSRLSRHVSDRLSSSLPGRLTSASTRTPVESRKLTASLPLPSASDLSDAAPIESNDQRRRVCGRSREERLEARNLTASLPSASDLSDKTENNDQRRRAFGANREESTRTFDSWAQTVNSADEMKGDLLVDWDLTKKMRKISLNESSYPLTAAAAAAAAADGGAEEDDYDAKNKGDNNVLDGTFPIEISEAFEALEGLQQSCRSAPVAPQDFSPAQIKLDQDFSPAQIKLDPANNVGNRLSKHMRRMSERLSSSLTSRTSSSTRTPGETWNLTASLPSEQREYQYHHRYIHNRGSMASWSLASSDHGVTIDTAINNQNQHTKLSILRARSSDRLQYEKGAAVATSVPAISPSREEDANRPIRISREDNVNIVELRRELLSAAASDKEGRSRRKSSFNPFAQQRVL